MEVDFLQSRGILIAAFNDVLLDTIVDLQKKFPLDDDLKVAKYQAQMAARHAPEQTVHTFVDAVQPFLQEIALKNEQFFIDHCRNDPDLAVLSLHDKWAILAPSDRELLWRRIHKLVVLGKQIKS